MRLFYKNAKMEHNAAVNIFVDIVSFLLSLTRNHEDKCGKQQQSGSEQIFGLCLCFETRELKFQALCDGRDCVCNCTY
jgi:hypothetical protein